MAGKKNSEEFQPKIIDVHIEFMQHRTPITEISLDELKRALPLPEGGCDFGTRKEALIVEFTGGRIVISDSGVIMCHFRSPPFYKAKKLVLDVIRYLCEKFDWLLEDQLFAIDADLVVEAVGDDPVKSLFAVVEYDSLRNLLGLKTKEGIHAIGFTIFLSPLKTTNRDFRLRIEPLFTEPDRKYYLRFSNVARELYFKDLEGILDEMANYAKSIASRLEGEKS